jgi:hypothetical protein
MRIFDFVLVPLFAAGLLLLCLAPLPTDPDRFFPYAGHVGLGLVVLSFTGLYGMLLRQQRDVQQLQDLMWQEREPSAGRIPEDLLR